MKKRYKKTLFLIVLSTVLSHPILATDQEQPIDLATQIQIANDEIRLRNETIKDLNSTNKKLEIIVNNTKENLRLWKDAYSGLENQNKELKKDIEKLDTQLKQSNEKAEQLNNETSSKNILIENNKKMIQSLQENIKTKEKEISQMSKKSQEMEKLLEQAQLNNKESLEKIKKLEGQVSQATQDKAQLQKNLSTLQENKESLENTVQKHVEEIRNQKEAMEAADKKTTGEINTLRTALNQQKTLQGTEKAKAQNEMKTVQNLLTTSQESNKNLSENIASMEQTLKTLQQENQKLTEENKGLKDENQRIQEKVSELESQKSFLQSDLENHKQQIQMNKEAFSAIEKERQSIQTKLAQSQDLTEQQKQELKEKASTIKDLQSEAEKINKILAEKEETLQELMTKYTALSKTLDDTLHDKKTAENKLANAQQTNTENTKKYEDQINRQNKTIKDSLSQIQGLEREYLQFKANSQSTNEKLTQEISTLKGKLTELETKNEALASQVETLTATNFSLNAKLSEAKSDIKVLTQEKTRAQEEVTQLQTDSGNNQTLLREKDKKIKDLDNQITILRKTEEDLQQALQKIAEYEGNTNALTEQIKNIQKDSQKTEGQKKAEIHKLNTEIATLNETINTHVASNKQLTAQNVALSKEVTSLQEALAKNEFMIEDLLNKSNLEFEKYEELQKQFDAVQKEKQSIEEKFHQSKTEDAKKYKELYKQYAAQSKELSEAMSLLKEVNKQTAETYKRIESENEKMEKLNKEKEEIEKQSKKQVVKAQELEKEIIRLATKCVEQKTEYENKYRQLNQEYNNHMEKINKMNLKITELETNNKELTHLLEKAYNEKTELEQKANATNEKVAFLESETNKLTLEIKQLKDHAQNNTTEVSKKTEEIKKLTAEIATLRELGEKYEAAAVKNQEYEKKLEEAAEKFKEHEDLKHQNNQNKKEKQEIEQKVQNLQSEIEELAKNHETSQEKDKKTIEEYEREIKKYKDNETTKRSNMRFQPNNVSVSISPDKKREPISINGSSPQPKRKPEISIHNSDKGSVRYSSPTDGTPTFGKGSQKSNQLSSGTVSGITVKTQDYKDELTREIQNTGQLHQGRLHEQEHKNPSAAQELKNTITKIEDMPADLRSQLNEAAEQLIRAKKEDNLEALKTAVQDVFYQYNYNENTESIKELVNAGKKNENFWIEIITLNSVSESASAVDKLLRILTNKRKKILNYFSNAISFLKMEKIWPDFFDFDDIMNSYNFFELTMKESFWKGILEAVTDNLKEQANTYGFNGNTKNLDTLLSQANNPAETDPAKRLKAIKEVYDDVTAEIEKHVAPEKNKSTNTGQSQELQVQQPEHQQHVHEPLQEGQGNGDPSQENVYGPQDLPNQATYHDHTNPDYSHQPYEQPQHQQNVSEDKDKIIDQLLAQAFELKTGEPKKEIVYLLDYVNQNPEEKIPYANKLYDRLAAILKTQTQKDKFSDLVLHFINPDTFTKKTAESIFMEIYSQFNSTKNPFYETTSFDQLWKKLNAQYQEIFEKYIEKTDIKKKDILIKDIKDINKKTPTHQYLKLVFDNIKETLFNDLHVARKDFPHVTKLGTQTYEEFLVFLCQTYIQLKQYVNAGCNILHMDGDPQMIQEIFEETNKLESQDAIKKWLAVAEKKYSTNSGNVFGGTKLNPKFLPSFAKVMENRTKPHVPNQEEFTKSLTEKPLSCEPSGSAILDRLNKFFHKAEKKTDYNYISPSNFTQNDTYKNQNNLFKSTNLWSQKNWSNNSNYPDNNSGYIGGYGGYLTYPPQLINRPTLFASNSNSYNNNNSGYNDGYGGYPSYNNEDFGGNFNHNNGNHNDNFGDNGGGNNSYPSYDGGNNDWSNNSHTDNRLDTEVFDHHTNQQAYKITQKNSNIYLKHQKGFTSGMYQNK